jgi:hypothetical protein
MQAEAPKDTMYANEHSFNIEALKKVGGSNKYSKITQINFSQSILKVTTIGFQFFFSKIWEGC